MVYKILFVKFLIIYAVLTFFSSYIIFKYIYYIQNPVCDGDIFEVEDINSKTENIESGCNDRGVISEWELNSVNFNPIASEGAMGHAVITRAEEKCLMKRLFRINYYNLLASDKIPLNRTLPDVRSDSCRLREYAKNLPTTSVIIVFHNEAWSVLLRTIWSIVNRTPKHLLKEIILVDDASQRVFLKDDLDLYIKKVPVSINIIRMRVRNGIVAARLAGANIACGDVLTFLDAHCECLEGWIEPLLARIKEQRNTVICPIVDSISKDNFSYHECSVTTYMFNWQLEIIMEQFSYKETYIPLKTPIMTGGLFSIDRNYFFEMGTYDSKMKIWGGENIEMSFRIWQCGGQVELHPCARVGHIDRDDFPYTFPKGKQEISDNLERAALVWMDEWSDFFFLYNSVNLEYFHNRNRINVTNRLNLRKKLRCKPFSWYLKNVWPKNFFPADDRFYGKIVWLHDATELNYAYHHFLYKISKSTMPTKWSDIILTIWKNAAILIKSMNFRDNYCLQSHGNNKKCKDCDLAGIGTCVSDSKLLDNFVITDEGIIMANQYNCLNFAPNWKYGNNAFNIVLNKCNYKTKWEYDFNTQKIFLTNTTLCLTVEKYLITTKNIPINIEYTAKGLVTVKICSEKYDQYQKWAFIPLAWKYDKI